MWEIQKRLSQKSIQNRRLGEWEEKAAGRQLPNSSKGCRKAGRERQETGAAATVECGEEIEER